MDAYDYFSKEVATILSDIINSEDFVDEMPKVMDLRIKVIQRHNQLELGQLQRINILLGLIDNVVRDMLNLERVERIRKDKKKP